MGNPTEFKPGDELSGDKWIYSQNGKYRLGVKDNKAVVERVHSDGKSEEAYTLGEAPKGASNVKLQFDDESWFFHAGSRDLKLRYTQGRNGNQTAWTGGPQNGEPDWNDDDDLMPDRVIVSDDGRVVALRGDVPKGGWDPNKSSYVSMWGKPQEDKPDPTAKDKNLPTAGTQLKDVPLELKIPEDGNKPSAGLLAWQKVLNRNLEHLRAQMGKINPRMPKDSMLPKLLMDPKNNKGSAWHLDADRITNLSLKGKGNAAEAFNYTVKEIGYMNDDWQKKDADLFKAIGEVSVANIDRIRAMHTAVADANKAIADSLKGAPDDIEKTRWDAWKTEGDDAEDKKRESYKYEDYWGKPGIQDPVEEHALYKLMSDAVNKCIKEVVDYAEETAKYAKDHGIEPEPEKKEQKPGSDEKPGQNEKPATNNNPPPANTNNTPPYQDTPPPAQTTPTEQAMFPDPESNPALDGLGLDSPNPTDPTGTVDSTQPTLGDTSGDTPAGTPDISSLIQAAMQGSGNNPGTVTPASNVPPPNNSGGGSNPMADYAMMSALGNLANPGNRIPGDDRVHDDKDSRDERKERDKNRTAPAATANATAPTAPPGVTAPTYAGTPPPVTTPGAMVDLQIGDKTAKLPQLVAEPFQKQTQNVALDAISALRGTAGELSADHPPAVINSRDPQAFNTGDILQWERHSALIYKENNQLFVLDNGQLIPFDPNKPPLEEKYGVFTGYIHPTGLDGAAGGDPGVASPPPPPVSAGQQPAGPPPVPPQQT
ncbi:hypothetical protein [Nocardia amamiensis]|uniref:hypothetical protein n=1 Tax=Nocardia amamiensis TaxID=404578 RepID=UPI0033EE2718